MKRILYVVLVLGTFALTGCSGFGGYREQAQHEDGVYRGVFIDGDSIQVNVEFALKDGIVQEASFRRLHRDYADYHVAATEEPYRSVVQQYKEVLAHLVGKHLETHLADLYEPENIITTEVDGYTRATVRSNKVLSAIRDGLNRGVYSRP